MPDWGDAAILSGLQTHRNRIRPHSGLPQCTAPHWVAGIHSSDGKWFAQIRAAAMAKAGAKNTAGRSPPSPLQSRSDGDLLDNSSKISNTSFNLCGLGGNSTLYAYTYGILS